MHPRYFLFSFNIGLFVSFLVGIGAQGADPVAPSQRDVSRPVSSPVELGDFMRKPVRMIIGGSMLGQEGANAEFAKNGYGCDDYGALEGVMKRDGFNGYVFGMNSVHDDVTWLAWKTKAPDWDPMPNCDFERDLQAADAAGMLACAEFLVAGMSNKRAADAHPDWRALDYQGHPAKYMGDLLSWNSPYWKQDLLPLYQDLTERYGNRLGAMVLWEPQLDFGSKWDREAFEKSGQKDFRLWTLQCQMEKWRELSQTVRAAGWKGKMIGGGWGAFEFEEHEFDGTVARLQNVWDMVGPFREGLVPVMMPELLIHANYGAGPYRREDAHYVYRSLMYERSVFGDAVIPNFELFWQRAMTPDEVMRWLLECYSAGYPSYSVMGMEKLYLEKYAPEQVEYRPILRRVFQKLNTLPWFGRPVVNFQFLNSVDLENSLYTPLAGWVLRDASWSPDFWREGDACGAETRAAGQTVIAEHYIADGPVVGEMKVESSKPWFAVNMPSADYEMKIRVWDGTAGRCALWADHKLGDIELTGSKTMREFSFALSHDWFDKSGDADPRAPGKQTGFYFAEPDGGTLTVPLKIDRVDLWKEGRLMGRIELENGSLRDWYVREVSSLFKEVDRRVCGGAVVSNPLTSLPDESLYGLAGRAVQVVLVPKGFNPPSGSKKTVRTIAIDPQATLAERASEITELVRPGLSFHVGKKDPLVYANLTRRPDGREFLTVINHAATPGSIEVELPWEAAHLVVDSSLIDKKVEWQWEGKRVVAHLDGFGSLVVSNRE